MKLANRLLRAAARSGRQVVGSRNSALRKEFDAEFYLETNPDVKAAKIPPLSHYLSYGWREGRAPAPWFDPAAYLREHPDLVDKGMDPFSHLLKHGDVEQAKKAGRAGFAGEVLEKFETDYFKALVAAAVDLDPMVALPNTKRGVSVVTETNKAVAECARYLRKHFAGRKYRYVVLVPHARMSGASRVGSIFIKALSQARKSDDILVLFTDDESAEFESWFPGEIESLNIWGLIRGLEARHKIACLYDILRGVEAELVVNINTRLGWETLKMYGRQIGQEMKVFTYMFTWDEAANGVRVGYPIQWLRETTDFHDAILTDNDALAADISQRMLFSSVGSAQARVLRTPVDPAGAVSAAEPAGGPVFLWAGRFDRQKRLDLLAEIARRLPNASFHIYGKPVLDDDSGKILSGLPKNCILKGTYRSLADVLAEPYSAYVYTSQWDGMPTILLDIAQCGLPIVAPRVGAVPNLVTNERGWLIGQFDDVAAYVDALNEIAADPGLAREKAQRLKQFVNEEHSMSAYRAAIAEMLEQNGL